MPVFKPDMPALAEALAEFFKATEKPVLEGKQAYEARIAANLLAIIRRELEQGESSRAREQSELQQLLGHAGSLRELNEELCSGIRQGGIDNQSVELMRFLRTSALSRLAIDNPRYSAFLKANLQPRLNR